MTRAGADSGASSPRAPTTPAWLLSQLRRQLVRSLAACPRRLVVAVVIALVADVLLGRWHVAGGTLVHEASVLVVILNAVRLLRTPAHSTQPRPDDVG